MVPNIAKPSSRPTMPVEVKTRLVRSRGGKTGSGACCSRKTKAARVTTVAAPRPITWTDRHG
jgi:hypothetical protein